jgi:ABC-2 type transport system ATP-binding protein
VVSSHVLEEVERFGSNVLVISQGRLAAQGNFHAIRELMDDRPRRVRVRTDRPRELAGALVASGTVTGVQLADDQIEIDTHDARALASVIAPLAQRESASLFEVRPLDESLESVFRYLVERR